MPTLELPSYTSPKGVRASWLAAGAQFTIRGDEENATATRVFSDDATIGLGYAPPNSYLVDWCWIYGATASAGSPEIKIEVLDTDGSTVLFTIATTLTASGTAGSRICGMIDGLAGSPDNGTAVSGWHLKETGENSSGTKGYEIRATVTTNGTWDSAGAGINFISTWVRKASSSAA